jgi:hypothetical protein
MPDDESSSGPAQDRANGRHWVLAATFSVNAVGTPFIDELAVVPTTMNWLIEDAWPDTAALLQPTLRPRSDVPANGTVYP